jgi:transmembrane sensor
MSFLPKSRSRIRREASDWVARLAGQAGAEDQAAFRRWRDADPRHAEAYDRIVAIWHQAGQLSSRARGAARAAPSSARPRTFPFALAASLAAVALISVLLFGSRWLPGSGSQQQPMLLAAAVGEIRQVNLPDGSQLTLDSASKVQTAFTKKQRTLTLIEGRARFQVAHEARPFVVRAGSSEVVATGTLFDVSLTGGRTDVVLLQGSVEVRAKDGRSKTQRLEPGQKLIVAAAGPPERRPATRTDSAWPARMLEFDNTRLDEAAALANRYSKIQLRLGSERIRSLRVSGAFRAGDVAGFARSLAAAFHLRIVTQPDGSLLLVDSNAGDHPPAK